jgi:hypothetical protein
MTTKSSAISKRNLDSFLIFQDSKFVSGYQGLITMQPLNKAKVRGWFIRSSDLDACGWSAKESDFENKTVIWDYEQMFGMPPNTTREKGLNFTEPRIQILLRSPLMVEETTGMRQTIGTFDDPVVKAMFEEDRKQSDLANSKGEHYKRRYGVRTKYLVYILTKENKRAHKIPIVLTLKGLNGTDLAEKIKIFEKEMSKCLSKALDSQVPLMFNEKFYSTTVFVPKLSSDYRGSNNVEIVAVESFDLPDYSTQQTAIESLALLSIPDEDRESSWEYQEMYQDYINQHAKLDAARLKGAYGIKEGVNILPQSRTNSLEEDDASTVEATVVSSNKRDSVTGEDEMF